MFINITKRFILILLLIFLTACNVSIFEDDIIDFQIKEMEISDLIHIENFRNGALEHILEGEINKNGEAVGFHFENVPTKKGNVISGTRTEPNKFGVYEAEVEVEGVKKRSNRGTSSFFPIHWNAQEVVDAINEAYNSKVYLSGNTYEGMTDEGIVIRMYLDQNEQIISAFPIK